MADLNIGTLSGRIELEDNLSPSMALVIGKLDQLEKKLGSVGGHIGEAAAGFLTAELALKALEAAGRLAVDVMEDITTTGAQVADVEENFDRLTDQAGRLGETLLGELREGTHNTITDFQLMKLANEDLATGMVLTDQQFRTLTDGAFALAQATGGQVAPALDTMNDALRTGRTRAIEMLTGKINLVAAEKDFAASLGTTVDKLSEEGRLEAKRIAILESVGAATARLGEQTNGLDEFVAQLQVRWVNFYDDLLKTIAASPNVMNAFTSIRDALVGAFGGDSQDMLAAVVGWVNQIADAVAEYGPRVIDAFVQTKEWIVGAWVAVSEAATNYGPIVIGALRQVRDWVLDIWAAVRASWDALPEWLQNAAINSVLFAGGLTAIGFAGKSAFDAIDQIINVAGNFVGAVAMWPALVANIGTSFGKLGAAALGAIGPLAAVAATIGAIMIAWEVGKMEAVSDFFMNIGLMVMGYSESERAAMIETDKLTQAMVQQAEQEKQQAALLEQVKGAQAAVNEAVTRASTEWRANTATVTDNTNALDRNRFVLKITREEEEAQIKALEELTRLGRTWQDTIRDIPLALQQQIQKYLEMGASIDLLVKAFPELKRVQIDAIREGHEPAIRAIEAQKEAYKLLAENGVRDLGDALARIPPVLREQAERLLALGLSAEKVAAALGLTKIQVKELQEALQQAHGATGGLGGGLDSLNGKLDETAQKVRTLSGELITLAEHQARQQMGGSFETTAFNLAGVAESFGISGGIAENLARQGYSFQEIVDSGGNPTGPPRGPRIPGFIEGGMADFGPGALAMFHGPELIIPLDKLGSMGGTTNHFYVNGTADDVANKIAGIFIGRAKMGRRFGAA